jgi:hypothetical protein
MSVELLQVSIVVTAKFHNPSILHPSFLASEGIVPSDWKTEGDIISTPVSSTVRYDNGIVFAVEPGKLQVTEGVTAGTPLLSIDRIRAPQLVERYVGVLPKVPYQAVGINPQGFVQANRPADTLVGRFLKDGALASFPKLTGVELRFAYEVAGARLRFGLSVGAVKFGEGASREGIVLSGNYHQDTADVGSVLTAVSRYRELLTDFVRTGEAVLR